MGQDLEFEIQICEIMPQFSILYNSNVFQIYYFNSAKETEKEVCQGSCARANIRATNSVSYTAYTINILKCHPNINRPSIHYTNENSIN